MPTIRTTLYALLATGLLAVGAFAAPVLAEDGNETSGSKGPREAAQEHREKAEERRAAAKERHNESHADWKAACRDRNETLNETQQRRCMAVKEFDDRAHKARREAHALLGAIAAIERRIGRLEVREMALQEQLDSGNFTGNKTAENVTAAIEKIQEHQERLAEKLAHLKERLEALHAKWAAVRDHVEERRHRGADDGGDDEDEGSSPSSSSSSSSETVTASESSTSTSA